MYASGLWPITIQKSKLDKNKAYVFVANHFSYLDILSLNVQVPHYFRFMAKSELGKIPLFKIFFGTIDISVNRSSIKDSHKAFTYADEALQQGESLGIFPEGRIGNNVPTMSRFKNGAFKLAIENNIAVVPVSILDNWKRLPDGGLESGGTPGKMRVIVHEPINTDQLTLNDMNALSDKVFDIIQNTFNEFNFASKNENPG
jgi:1-acyl-sn-glycerol-3-phosphate acyltransferase